jgi:hypothetical protein
VIPAATPLDRLAAAWVRAHAHARTHTDAAGEEDVSELELLLTTRAPFRGRALEEVRIFARTEVPAGHAMEIRTKLSGAATPFEGWTRAVHPFVFELRWASSAENQQRSSVHLTIDRVAFEDGEWRVVSVYDEPSLSRARREAELHDKARGR